jgi:hypothetical protein
MNRHLLALSKVKLVTCQLVSHLLNAKASPEERARFSILREDQVVTLECCCSTDTRGFLSKLSHIERNSALSLCCVVYLIGFVDCDHRVVHLEDFSIGNFSVVARIDDLAIFVHDSETLHFVERAAEVHFGRELMFKELLINFIHRSK